MSTTATCWLAEVERALHAGKRQQRLLLGADDFDLDAQFVLRAAAELLAVGGLAHGAGGDGLAAR